MPSYIMGQGSERIREILLGMNQIMEVNPDDAKGYADSDKKSCYFFYDIASKRMLLIDKTSPRVHISEAFPQGWLTVREKDIPKFLNVLSKDSKMYEETTQEKNMKAFR
jgi:hypothetical protein